MYSSLMAMSSRDTVVTRKKNVGAQKIDGSTLETNGIVICSGFFAPGQSVCLASQRTSQLTEETEIANRRG